jgi:hypothetical protein
MSTRSSQIRVSGGARFEFGKNRRSFLSVLNHERIAEAECSLS